MMPRSTDEAGPSGVKGTCNSSDLVRIEDLIRGSTFSREDVSRLVELLNSRAVVEILDSRAEVGPEKNNSSSNAEADAAQDPLMLEITRTLTPEKQQDVNRSLMRRFSDKANVAVGVGASPVDIARAFMAGRTLERGHDLHSFTSKDERILFSNDFALKPFAESPLSRPSICWPGSVVPDRHGYATPQSQRSRYGPRDFPGTPYSKTILSKSTTKVQADSRLANASTPFQQSQSPIPGQVWSRGETVEGEGSVGPIRRIRNKFSTEVRPRGSIFRSVPRNAPPKVVKANEFTGFLPSTKDSLEPGETSEATKNLANKVSYFSDTSLRDPNPTASQAVRKILEHLDRTKPTTPNEKEKELVAASKRKNSSTSESSSICEEKTNSLNFGDYSTNKSIDKAGPSFPAEFIKSGNDTNYLGKHHDRSEDEANIAGSNDVKTPNALFADSSKRPAANAMPSFDLARNYGASINNLQRNVFSSSNDMQKEKTLHQTMKANDKNPIFGSISKIHTTKHSLPPISTSKPYSQEVSSNNGSTFSFPVSASSSIFTEPPTPSIMPSSPPVKVPSKPQDGVTIPSYEIGKNRSTKRIVFSFPSASSSEAPEASDIKFTIGSEKKSRLSFGAFEKNAICS